MKYVAAGEAHSSSIDTVGNVYTWGAGSYGRLGHGEESDIPVPMRIQALSGIKMEQVELGTLHSIALSDKGVLYSWGSGEATGLMETGGKEAGLGPTTITKRKDEHDEINGLQGIVFTSIACGAFHSLALATNGDMYCWGLGSEGRLASDELQPELVPALLKVTLGDAGMRFRTWVSFDLLKTTQKSTGQDKNEELEEARQHALQAISCGGMHSGAIVGTGEFRTLYMWGSNEYGQIGVGDLEDKYEPTPVILNMQVAASIKVDVIALGLEHGLLVTADASKTVYAWGRNHFGQLGLGRTDDEFSPKPLQGLMNVIKIAAGEDHSAAIVETGELYTWGNAECGKLGYGAGMTSGPQNYPRVVRTDEQFIFVSCGSQHTAALDANSKLYTFGAGWYGRLGHGNMDNQYSPKRVEAFGTVTQVSDVQCGGYHTVALVGQHRHLWLCGRDRTVCNDDHVSLFKKFTKGDWKDWSVEQVAVGAMHTVVLTKSGEVYAWGVNSKGQLGCKDALVRSPTKIECGPAGCIVKSITTGYAHTMAMVQVKRGKDDFDADSDIFVCGADTGGRLGRGSGALAKGPAMTFEKMSLPWQSKERNDRSVQPKAEEGGGDGNAAAAQPKSKLAIFGVLQKKLKEADIRSEEVELRKEEKKLEELYHMFINDIWSLWSRPIHSDGDGRDQAANEESQTEWTLRMLQSRLEKSLCKNLITMGLAETYPQIDGSLTHPDIAAKLVHYEEMLWILQQQPCYLARLAQQLSWGEPTHANPSTIPGTKFKTIIPSSLFMDVVGQIFKRLRDDRTKRLYMSLIRVMIKYEVAELVEGEKKRDKEQVELFDPTRSKVAALVRLFCEHQVFHKLHDHIYEVPNEVPKDKKLDQKDQKDDTDVSNPSLVSIILEWTVEVHDSAISEDTANNIKNQAPEQVDEGILFVFTEEEMKHFAHGTKKDTTAADYETAISEQLHKFLAKFSGFLGVKEEIHTQSVTNDGKSRGGHAHGGHHGQSHRHASGHGKESKKSPKKFSDWLEKLKLPEELACVFEMVRDILGDARETEKSIMQQFELQEAKKKEAEEERNRELLKPVVVLFMCAVIGNLLENYEKIMPSSNKERMRTKLRRRVRERAGEDSEDNTEAIFEKLKFNIQQLGRFLTKAAIGDFRSTQKKLARFGTHLKDKYIIPHLVHELKGVTDNTEIELTQDLYKSHYDMQRISIMVGTKSLLHLSNALFMFADKVIDVESPANKESDLLYRTLVQTLPNNDKNDKADGKPSTGKMPWPDHMLLIAERTSVQHNFTVQHRFLETHQDLCFCRNCLAPILRTMAPKEQRSRSELRLIRTYRSDPGLNIDGTFPQKTLLDVLGLKELPPIKSRDWLSLKSEFEEIQKVTKDKISKIANKALAQKEFHFVEQLEQSKNACDLLRTSGHQPDGMVKYVLLCIENLEDHRHYLKKLDDGKDGVENAQAEYKNKLQQMIEALQKVVQASEEATLPAIFKNRALEKGKQLKFQYVERLNRQRAVTDSRNLLPSVTMTLGNLRAKKVVAWVSEDLPRSQYKRISFTFNGLGSDNWQVIVRHTDQRRTHALFQFEITRSDVERMQHAGKTARIPYNDGWVVINAFALLQLLARCTAEA